MYPGLGLSLRCPGHDPKYVTAVDSELESASELLLVREVAMMGIMDQLTEKPDWHIKVFDDVIASKWIDEALAIPVESLWATCVPKLAHLDPVTDRPKRPKEILDRACLEYVGRGGALVGCKRLLRCSVHTDMLT